MKKEKEDFRAGFKGKDIIICDNFFSKARGLMFRPADFKTPLLFIWKKPGKYPIHSFFCRKFAAVWYSDGKIIEKRVIEPWKASICPTKEFDSLIEIPR